MAVSATTTQMEQKELDKIDGILPTLYKKGLLTYIDCRLITSCNTLTEKKAAVYTAIMSKSKGKAVSLTKRFRKMTKTIRSKEKSTSLQNDADSKNEGCTFLGLQQKNPFLINPIIKHLFGFLPLEDLKRSRLVCREWNSAAELFLRNRSAIHFRHDTLIPHTFMEVSKSLNSLPFPSFVFFDEDEIYYDWQISKIEDFFKMYGQNIKEVTFDRVTLTTKCDLTDSEVCIPYYDVTPLFINPSNITRLIIRSQFDDEDEDENEKTIFDISLEKFVSLKTLSLTHCRIIVSVQNQSTRIAPLNVDFDNVCIIQNGEPATHLRYNNLVDFSKTLNISLCHYLRLDIGIFDMDKQVFNVNQLYLSHIYENWSLAKGNMELLKLSSTTFLERNHLKIKQLQLEYSKVDLSALPETLEILQCQYQIEIVCSGEFFLPNLKYLSIPGRNIDSLAYFSNCHVVELETTSPLFLLNLSLIPKSVKRLKMWLNKFKFTDDSILELDTLILQGCGDSSGWKHCKRITAQIKAKVLVVELNTGWYLDTCHVVHLVLTNMQSEKFIIGSTSDLHKYTPFEGSEFSKYVDKKSNYYQFENSFGKSITKANFEEFTIINHRSDVFNYNL